MKQSAFVISLLLANSASRRLNRPANNQYFASGLNAEGDLLEKVEYGPNDTIRVGEQRAQTAPAQNATSQAQTAPVQNATSQVQKVQLIDKQGAAVGCPKGYTLNEHKECHFEFQSLTSTKGDDDKPKDPSLNPYWWNLQAPEKVEHLTAPIA